MIAEEAHDRATLLRCRTLEVAQQPQALHLLPAAIEHVADLNEDGVAARPASGSRVQARKREHTLEGIAIAVDVANGDDAAGSGQEGDGRGGGWDRPRCRRQQR